MKKKKIGLKQFLAKYGKFREAEQFFYHYRLNERLTGLGLRVISIERLDTHPVWNIRLRGNLEAQTNLLLGKSYKGKRPASWGSGEVIEQRLKAQMQSILKSLGQAVKADDLNVVRYGGYFQIVRLAHGAAGNVVPAAEAITPAPSIRCGPALDQAAA